MPVPRIQNVLRRAALAIALLAAGAAHALSVGEIALQSHLGEPLRAVVPLGKLGTLSADQILVGRAPEATHKAYGIDHASYTSPLRFALQVDAKGEASVLVTSEQPVTEPMVDMVLEVKWPSGRSVKHFTLLLDPSGR